jgi:hypothetical protein
MACAHDHDIALFGESHPILLYGLGDGGDQLSAVSFQPDAGFFNPDG